MLWLLKNTGMSTGELSRKGNTYRPVLAPRSRIEIYIVEELSQLTNGKRVSYLALSDSNLFQAEAAGLHPEIITHIFSYRRTRSNQYFQPSRNYS